MDTDFELPVTEVVYSVVYDAKGRSTAHLMGSNGKTAFCGKDFSNRWSYCVAPAATIPQYIKDVRPRCAKCLEQARLVLAIDRLAIAMGENANG